MQQVHYPSLNKADMAKYYDTIVEIYTRIDRDSPDERNFKRYLRGQGWLDKDTFDGLVELLDLKIGKTGPVQLGSWAQAFLDNEDVEERKNELFLRLAGANEILVKYVFDAIQERLYSTSELYRMLTSYVYPGKRVDLPDFKNWLSWLQATDRIRVLGIRWAPGRKFDASASYIASIDVDEILEDEAEAELLGDGEDGGGEEESAYAQSTPAPQAEAPAAPAPPAPAPTPAPAPEPDDDDAATIGWEPPEDDEEAFEDEPPADLPPRAGTPSPDQFGQLAALLGQLGAGRPASPELIEARLLEPAPHVSALAAGAPLARVREALAAQPTDAGAWLDALRASEERQAENVRQLIDWWSGIDERPTLRSDQFGIMPFGEAGWQEGTRAKFLFRLACLAVDLLRRDDGDVAFAVLDGAGFFDALFEEKGSCERLLDELFEQGLGGRADLFGHLHLYLMLARSLRGAEAFCAALADMEADEALAELWKRLAAYQLDAEVVYIAREMSMFGLLRQEGLRSTRVVPTEEARKAAFHLGLLESARANSLPALLAASRRLTPMMAMELEAPLIALWRAYGPHLPSRFWSR